MTQKTEPSDQNSTSLEAISIPDVTDKDQAPASAKIHQIVDVLLSQTDKKIRKHIGKSLDNGAISLVWEHEYWEERWGNVLVKIQTVDGVFQAVHSKMNKSDHLKTDAVTKPETLDVEAKNVEELAEKIWPIYSKRVNSKWGQSEFTRKRKGGGASKKVIQIIFAILAVGFLAMRIFG